MTATAQTERAALYARISEDETGEALGVERQLQDARALALAHGWEIVAEFSDNDISATEGAFRPGYAALVAAVDAGRLDRVVIYQSSRLWRNRRERAEGIERFAKGCVSVAATRGQSLDLSTAYGRGIAGILGEFDTMESEVKSERVTSAAKQRAEKGDPNGAVPFGWVREVETNAQGGRIGARDVLDPETAPIVAEVCHRLLAGEPLLAVTAWLNAEGIPAPGAAFNLRKRGRGLANPDGTKWGKTSVRKLALRPQNAGLRLYHAGRPDERLLPMKADPIISRDEWERLKSLLNDPTRKTQRGGARRHLLSHTSVGRCGVCGGLLRSQTKRGRYGKPQTLYVCAERGCVGRNQASVDAKVSGAVVGRLAQADARDLLAPDDTTAHEALSRAAGLRARLDEAADQFADGAITGDQLARITAKLRPQLAQAEQDAAAASTAPVALLADLAGDLAAERWEALSVAQRVAVVGVLLESVEILPTTRRGPGFDPDSVRLNWR